MKRAASPDYFSSDEETDDLLAAAVDEFEQRGGAVPSPLFEFYFTPVGERRRWRNTVQGQTFHATLDQLRDATANDNVGEALTEALRVAINRELQTEHVRPYDRVNFAISANGFTHAFQSVNFEVQEFLEQSLRLSTLLQTLAEKLNSNEDFDPASGFEVTMAIITMPTPASGRKKYNPGQKCLDKELKRKHAIIRITNQDDLCCARAIVTMRAWCHRKDNYDSLSLGTNV